MRYRDDQFNAGDELTEGSQQYTVERVEQPPDPTALGHAWVKLIKVDGHAAVRAPQSPT
jgi:hypothetical protein